MGGVFRIREYKKANNGFHIHCIIEINNEKFFLNIKMSRVSGFYSPLAEITTLQSNTVRPEETRKPVRTTKRRSPRVCDSVTERRSLTGPLEIFVVLSVRDSGSLRLSHPNLTSDS